jgi:hypothetical protein
MVNVGSGWNFEPAKLFPNLSPANLTCPVVSLGNLEPGEFLSLGTTLAGATTGVGSIYLVWIFNSPPL